MKAYTRGCLVKATLLCFALFSSSCSGGASSHILPANTNPAPSVPLNLPTALTTPFSAQTSPSGTVTSLPEISQSLAPVEMTLPGGNNSAISKGPVSVTLNYYLSQTPTSGNITTNSTLRRHEYISTANTQINIGVTPFGGSTTSSNGNPCTPTVCSVTFSAIPGPNTLTLTLTNGTVTLSTFEKLIVVAPNASNVLNFTANAVVSSASVQLSTTTVNAGTPADVTVGIQALDAAGRVIVSNSPCLDSNGNPVLFTLNVGNNQAGGNGTSKILGSGVLASPTQTSILHYDGNWLASSTVSLTSNSSVLTALTGQTLNTLPFAVEYPVGAASPGLQTDRTGIYGGQRFQEAKSVKYP
jgi:hypothetical protein